MGFVLEDKTTEHLSEQACFNSDYFITQMEYLIYKNQ